MSIIKVVKTPLHFLGYGIYRTSVWSHQRYYADVPLSDYKRYPPVIYEDPL